MAQLEETKITPKPIWKLESLGFAWVATPKPIWNTLRKKDKSKTKWHNLKKKR